ncbi:MAG: 2-C-methyl-D-erythritol 4-phosphate cytidylyltransferase [Bacteroidales bacterium]|jgi:2-C-methyl-D-erythritol 4-phosphate cytidylyltransferase|nr:2-C-methyl-D-erythritol 4-phosphate cytidylyltransferase [Bacteroidales bacterium]
MKRYVLIVAGGTGVRMQSAIPKQFMELCGLPVLMHAIRVFFRYDASAPVTVVLPAAQLGYWEQLCGQYGFTVPHRVVEGGDHRFHSVKNGLDTLPDEGWVAIHDGVRPLVSHAVIDACFREAERYGNAIPAIPVTDSIRAFTDAGSYTVDRENLRLVQTPQVFDLAALKDAYRQEYMPAFTDDAAVLERKGYLIHPVEGNAENIKITTPRDLKIAEALLSVR